MKRSLTNSLAGFLPVILFISMTCAPSITLRAMQEESIDERPVAGNRLTDEQVAEFANLALKNIDTEYPNKPSNVMKTAEDVRSPKEMHPAFFGCFDWHSAIHGHWMLARLLKLYPDSSVAGKIREALNRKLTKDNLEKEAEYFRAEHNKSFERMYGWAWTYRMVAELENWDDEDAKSWRENFRPLEEIILKRTLDYLPKLSFPIRTGVHPDTAFALAQTLDYAKVVGNKELEQLVIERAKQFYLNDKNFNSEYEPSGEDFFSQSLNEADLMRRILANEEYQVWLKDFLPRLVSGESRILEPVEVSDVTDGKIVHLAGLDLSRAWCLQGIASQLSDGEMKSRLEKAAAEHLRVGLDYVFSGHYEGDHWLATFAVYGLSRVGIDE